MELRPNRRPPPNYGSRSMQWRLMLLVGALMLVLVMMDEARKPENWEWMGFRGSSNQRDDEPTDGPAVSPRLVDLFQPPNNANSLFQAMAADSTGSSDGESTVDSSQASVLKGTLARVLTPVFETLDNSARWDFTRWLGDLKRGEPIQADPIALNELGERVDLLTRAVLDRMLEEARLAAAAELPPSDTAVDLSQVATPWDDLLADMRHRFGLLSQAISQGSIPDEATVGDMQQLSEISAAWDQVLLDQIEDLSMGLRKDEQTAWYQMASQLARWESSNEAPSATPVSAYELEQQPDLYRGKWVRISGEVRRVDRIGVPERMAGVAPPWLLWIRPAAGPDNVIGVYVRHLPDRFPRPTDAATSLDCREKLDVDAVFFKREGYQATDVTRVAPRLIGNDIQWSPMVEEVAETPINWPLIGVIIVVNLLIAMGVAFWAARSTRRQPPTEQEAPDWKVPLSCLLLLGIGSTNQATELKAQELPPWLVTDTEVEPTSLDLERLFADWPRSELDRLGDATPLTANEPIGFELLERLATVGPLQLQRAGRSLDRATRVELLSRPADHRLEVVTVSGRLESIQILELDELTASEFDRTSVYRVVLAGEAAIESSDTPGDFSIEGPDLALDSGSIVLWLDHVPASWLDGIPVGDSVEATGVFLRLEHVTDEANRPPVPLVIARRLAWLTEEESAAGRDDWIDFGFDRGLWDDVAKLDGAELKSADGVTLYRLFHAIDLAKDHIPVSRPLDLFAVLGDGEAHLGQTLSFHGRIKRISEIGVGADLYATDAGVARYYQIDMLVSLEGNEVKLKSESQTATIVNTYPVTVCVTKLPESLDVGPEMDIPVQVTGVFYRNWRFQSAYVREVDQGLRQVAPLIVGISLSASPDGSEGAAMLTTIAAVLCCIALGGTLLVFGWLRVSDGRYQRESKEAKRAALPAQLDVSGISTVSAETPDSRDS